MADHNSKKNHCFEVLFSLNLRNNNNNPFLNWIMMFNESGFYMKTSDDQLSGWTEKKLRSISQSQTCTKKRSWSLFGGLLPFWSTTAFWILARPSHLTSMLSKSMRYTENCNICSQHWSTEQAQFFSMTIGPILLHVDAWLYILQPMLQTLNELGYEVLPWIRWTPYSLDLLPMNYHFFKHLDNFLLGKHFHNQQEAENAFPEFIESQSTDFYATGINKLIFCWQKCVDCNGAYSD